MILQHDSFELLQKVVLEHVVFRPPLKADTSMHDEACFLFAVQGESDLYGPTQVSGLNTDEGVIMKCGHYLNSWHDTGSKEPFEAVAVHFYPEVLKAVYKDELPEFLRSQRPENPVSIEKIAVNTMVRQYVDTLLFYFANPKLVTEELITLKIKELILLLVNTDVSGGVRAIFQDLFNPEVYDFKEIIHRNLYHDLSIEDFALLTGKSLSSFKRKFKAVFEESPARYIKAKRLEKAARLLENPGIRITDVCFDCGFTDLGHFSKSFHAHFGFSPSEYRKQQTA